MNLDYSPTQTTDNAHKALGAVVGAAFIFGLGAVVFLLLFTRDLGVDLGWVG